jgi:predicted chitinase
MANNRSPGVIQPPPHHRSHAHKHPHTRSPATKPGTVAEDSSKAAKPKILVALDISTIAPIPGDKAAIVADALNKATTEAAITTLVAQAMLIAQCAAETGGFAGEIYVEKYVDSPVVFNARSSLDAKFTTAPSQTPTYRVRYLHGHAVTAWRTSRDKYLKAQAAYETANKGKKYEDLTGENAWKPVAATDYVPGDAELPYWRLWYDVTSPFVHRSEFAKKNGNTDDGDGLKYIGRGFVMLTWRTNYREAGKDLGVDLEKRPEEAAKLENAIRIAARHWKKNSINKYANHDTADNFKIVTAKINGGSVGMEDRQAYYKKAKAVLGVK